ncbi:restriction endonuclease subunit S [Aliarcobacter skirrowii]|uniref:restriction endonuclease subunit S n=1 Tax=Aliarcobacter skirrowii TaxID=28200 RepID=UPI000835DCFC|nr:restriction endonuclease subunit S [Aliarcobacter skirrowii]
MAELYSLPDGWEWRTLGEIGKLFSGSSAPQKDEYFIDGKYPFIRTKDLSTYGRTDNLIEVNDYINDKCINDSSLILAKKGTVLFPKSGASIGTNNRAKIGINAYIVSHLGAFYSKEEVINKYVYNYFLTIDLLDYCENPSYPSLKISRVKEIEIPLPPLEEQKRIVAKLDILFAKIDKAIALHQKNCEEADIFMASVLNDVFVELEEKYEKKQLNQIVIFGGKNISTLEYPNLIYFSLEDIETQTGKILNYKTVNESGVKGTAVSFDDNVVLYSKLRPYLNKVIVPNLEGCATTELVVLKPKDKLDKYFLASYLRSSNIVSFLNNDSMGAKMPRTNMKTFRNLDIPLPPLKTQQKVVSYLDEISNKIEKIKQIQKEKMQSLKALKASILDKAFKGEL